MKTRGILVAILAVRFLSGQTPSASPFLSVPWVEVGERGQAIARVIVRNPQDCPAIQLDGSAKRMRLRQPLPQGLRPACELEIPHGARSASIHGQALTLPRKDPARIIALGDTGCRIKGAELQSCNDPGQWPFAQIAETAAADKPDLIIHVGDYLYRETPCPAEAQAMCGGTPNGDNWETWNADFFTPAAKLLAAAPWAFSRGNHEDCNRSWRGWFYYLDPRPWNGVCEAFSAPYLIKLGAFELVMLDSASVSANTLNEDQATRYAAQLSSLHPVKAWLADHHPFWGLRTDSADGKPAPVSPTLEAAWDRASPKGIELVLSGHIHIFELLSFPGSRPAQLVAGDGGTNLAVPIQGSIDGLSVQGVRIGAGQTQSQFGYTRFARHGKTWDVSLQNRAGEPLIRCNLAVIGNNTTTKCFTDISRR